MGIALGVQHMNTNEAGNSNYCFSTKNGHSVGYDGFIILITHVIQMLQQ